MVKRDPFAGRPHSPAEHFRLCFYGGVLLLRELVPDSAELLAPYLTELRGTALDGRPPRAARLEWDNGLTAWESASPARLPLRDLMMAAGLDRLAVTLYFALGLPEEDPRFCQLGPGPLISCWDDAAERARARRALTGLANAGLVNEADGLLRPDPVIWDAVRGDPPAEYEGMEDLPVLEELILPDATRHRVAAALGLLRADTCMVFAVLGPQASGRRTLLRAAARELGRGVLHLSAPSVEDPHLRAAGALATVMHALPVMTLDPGPGDAAQLPRLTAYTGPVGVRLPDHGRLDSDGAAATLCLGIPAAAIRARHWAVALGPHAPPDLGQLADSHRITGGTIRRIARAAVAEAAADGREKVTATDITAVGHTVRAELFGALAESVRVTGGWNDLVVNPQTREELLLLERRCRHRERLSAVLPAALGSGSGPGVRALFSGPSGTGKTLSARLLAAALGKDLYRLDLSGVVNKYLGETEKNLSYVLGRAEVLDVVLLIDEGDSLLAKRTHVRTSNDRYANLETNYLLQRLESFEGIVVVTTNSEEHIDDAFGRRLDAVIHFPVPGPAERLAIWEIHLPAAHAVDQGFLREAATRCPLTGGQVRAAVLHASLLALDDGGMITTQHAVTAVQREFRKTGAVCPLRTPAVSHA